MFDLAPAVTMGAVSSILWPHGVNTAVVTALPLSLIPTFAVPLLLMLHIICIAQARRKQGRYTRVESQVPASA